SLRSVKIIIDPVASAYSVYIIDPADGTTYLPVTSGALPASYYDPSTGQLVSGLPPSITFGWTAGTGGADDIHEITDVVVKTLYDTTTFAQSVPSTPIPTGGSPSVTLGNIEIDESEAGVLTAGGEIFLVLPSPLTFAGATPVAPTVSTLVSNGLTVGPAQFTSEAFDAIKFAITQASTSGAAKIVISNISVAVPSDNLPAMCAGGPFPSGQN